VLSGLSVAAYSPGRKRKKKPRISISARVLVYGVLAVWQRSVACAMIGKGIGFTRCGGGSVFL
jgi:hypothetical protein